jgi:hypothetical protein
MPKESPEAYAETGSITSLLRGYFSSCILHAALIAGVYAYHLSEIPEGEPDPMQIVAGDIRENVSKVLAVQKLEEKTAREFKERTGQNLEEVIGKLNPAKRRVFDEYMDAVKKRVTKRAKNVNPEKVRAFKTGLLRKLERGEEVPYDEFIFNSELIEGGVDAGTIAAARKVFIEEMNVLKKERPPKPTIEFLNRIIKFTEQYDADAYEPTQSNVSVYLARKGKNKRGNCEARQKYRTMALLHLYPELKDKIKIQRLRSSLNMEHLRALMEIDGEPYMLEDSARLLTDRERCGSIIYSPRRVIENYTGFNTQPIDLECPEKVEVEETGPVANIPAPPTDSTLEQPESAQPLPPLKWDKTDYLDEFMLPPETENEDPAPAAGNRTELLLQEDLPTEYLRRLLDTDGLIYLEEDIKSPTVATIRRANALVRTDNLLGVAYRGDISTYTPEALAEALNNNAPWTDIILPYPVLPPALKHVLQNEDKYGGDKGWFFITVKAPLKLEEGKQTISGFSEEDLEAMNHGKKCLTIRYRKDHNISVGELRIISRLNRPYIELFGVCLPDIIFDRSFLHSMKPTLALTTQDYLSLAAQDPDLLQESKLQSISFVETFKHSRTVNRDMFYHDMLVIYLMIRQFEEQGVSPENIRILREIIEKFRKILPDYEEHIYQAERDSASYAVPGNLPQYIRPGCRLKGQPPP